MQHTNGVRKKEKICVHAVYGTKGKGVDCLRLRNRQRSQLVVHAVQFVVSKHAMEETFAILVRETKPSIFVANCPRRTRSGLTTHAGEASSLYNLKTSHQRSPSEVERPGIATTMTHSPLQKMCMRSPNAALYTAARLD
ncbi:hypothetical protein IG631_09960 [Alternaria alternata]|nr:hypothetical protein IG631_09960 [Alternaria alternata]